MTDSKTMNDILYGDGTGTARPFVPGTAVFGCLEADRGPDGVWVVPFREQHDFEEGSIDRR